MTCACNSSCPAVVPTINRTEVTQPDYPSVGITVSPVVVGKKYMVELQVTEDISTPWLIRIWFTDSDSEALLGKESLVVPEVPGISQFFKVTDATGYCELSIEHDGDLSRFLNACVVGRVATSSELIFST